MRQPPPQPQRPAQVRAYITAAVLALLLAACGQPSPSPTTRPSDGDPQGSWQLVEGTVNGEPVPILDEHRITLTIEGSRIGGTSACNSYGGRVTVESGRLRIEDLAQTMMGCEEPAMAAEAIYMSGLGAAESIGLGRDQLLVRGPGVDLRFVELVPPPTAEMVDTVWMLGTLIMGDTASAPIGDAATLEIRSDGTIHGSTGCRSFEGTWLEQGDEIVTTSLRMQEVACGPELQDADNHVLGVVGDGFRASVDGDRLTLTGSRDDGLVYRASE